MKDVLLGMTSKNLEVSPVSWGLMITYLGLWILMYFIATGGNTRAYWDNLDSSLFKGDLFRLHILMSFALFDAITKPISFTDHTTPLYRHKFWQVRKMIHAWN